MCTWDELCPEKSRHIAVCTTTAAVTHMVCTLFLFLFLFFRRSFFLLSFLPCVLSSVLAWFCAALVLIVFGMAWPRTLTACLVVCNHREAFLC